VDGPTSENAQIINFLFCLDVIKRENGIMWKGRDWAENCYFSGSDIITLSLDKDQCAVNCSIFPGQILTDDHPQGVQNKNLMPFHYQLTIFNLVFSDTS
jgi:hypothetical protein